MVARVRIVPTRALSSGLTVTGDTSGAPPLSPSPDRSRKPSSVAAPRSAKADVPATTTSPIAARPAKPPAMPAEMTSRNGSSASSRDVATAAATGPTPPAATTTSPARTARYGRSVGLAGPRSRSAASRSATTAVTTRTVNGSARVRVHQRELPEAAGLALASTLRQRHDLDVHRVALLEVGGEREVALVLLDRACGDLVTAVNHAHEPAPLLDVARHLDRHRRARPDADPRRLLLVLAAVADVQVRLPLEAPQRRVGQVEVAARQRADLGDRLLAPGEQTEAEHGGDEGRGATGKHAVRLPAGPRPACCGVTRATRPPWPLPGSSRRRRRAGPSRPRTGSARSLRR